MLRSALSLLVSFFAAVTLSAPVFADAGLPQVATGHIERWENFPSHYVEARNIDIWLPDGYPAGKHYNVIYLHDGQMLYDAATTWNKQAWHIQDAVARLVAQGAMDDTIVVGIWNNDQLRRSEYFPEKALPGIQAGARRTFIDKLLSGKPRGDDYLRFVVTELKPAIDAKFATRPERASTAIMGSSMGGLISLYALSEYPETFGAAACLSTHWTGIFEANSRIPLALFEYFQANLPNPGTHKLYMDRGTATLDALYSPHQEEFDLIARDRGYADAQYMSRVFDGAAHTETDWAKRADIALAFIGAKTRK